jgi:hypothetical protein
VVGIPHSPRDVTAVLSDQSRRVRDRRNVLADFVGIGVVLLELDPLCLSRQGREISNEARQLIWGFDR